MNSVTIGAEHYRRIAEESARSDAAALTALAAAGNTLLRTDGRKAPTGGAAIR